jgi:rhodanese-related sulfurtransferase
LQPNRADQQEIARWCAFNIPYLEFIWQEGLDPLPGPPRLQHRQVAERMAPMFGLKRPPAAALTVATVAQKVAAGQMVLIDVRDQSEVAQTGMARGALHIPLMRLPMVADPRHPDFDARLAGGKPVAVYCASGGRSGMAVNLLQRLGHAEVHNIGGLHHWQAGGGEILRHGAGPAG